jgi:hypothetical protein
MKFDGQQVRDTEYLDEWRLWIVIAVSSFILFLRLAWTRFSIKQKLLFPRIQLWQRESYVLYSVTEFHSDREELR